jgi:hypothetical protein
MGNKQTASKTFTVKQILDPNGHIGLKCLKCYSTDIRKDPKEETAICKCGEFGVAESIVQKFRIFEKRSGVWTVGPVEYGIDPDFAMFLNDPIIERMRECKINGSFTVTGGDEKSLRAGIVKRSQVISKERKEKHTFMVRKYMDPTSDTETFRVWRVKPRI